LALIKKFNLSGLKSGDMVLYTGSSSELLTGRILNINAGAFVINSQSGSTEVPGSKLYGIYIMKVPYLGFILEYASTRDGIAVCSSLALLIILLYVFIIFLDVKLNTSRHKKMILRKRRRRSNRYKEEGQVRQKRAVV
jgi:hypothetical protein